MRKLSSVAPRIQRLGQRQFRQAVEADDLAQQSPEGRLQQIAPLGEERGQAVAVVLRGRWSGCGPRSSSAFLPADPQLAEQAHKARIGAIVVDDKSGIDGPVPCGVATSTVAVWPPGVAPASNSVT
ncbi:hypothetical protein IE991_04125 [Klebsiella pneumoniae]|uniref:Uncharacterized protein n=1 Tax=Klebsiella pneumoniae TaxID=573 RepID=A0A927HHH5_KLEPN|nr:hypothetical protein [Klebsiella pneumoniae]